MAVRIIVKHKLTDEEYKEYSLDFSQDTISLGRQESNDVPLPDQKVSRKHAMIVAQGNDFYLIDLGSSNGTILNNVKLKPKEKKLLRDNDIIKIEKFEIIFRVKDIDFTPESLEGTKTIARKMVEEILKVLGTNGEHPVIKVVEGTNEGDSIVLTKDVRKILIGRDKECDFILLDISVSRKHAEIIQDWNGEIRISDLNSTNGTFVNDKEIKTNYKLNDRDYITIGNTRLIFLNPRERYLDQFEVPTPIPMGREEVEIQEKEKITPSNYQEEKKEKEGEEEKVVISPPSEVKPTTSKLEIIFLIIGGAVFLLGTIILIVLLFL